jgi:MoaA/NifB/PqqE/SkfB family radical SAM enzyme
METTTRPRRTGAWIPGVVDLSVTNHCNATCDFCSFAYDKNLVRQHRFVDRAAVARALPLLRRRGIAYLNFQGGEPLLHPEIIGLVADARTAGLKPSLITNGWKLPDRIGALADAGLQNLLVSIDSADLDAHERNRGLRGARHRIKAGLDAARGRGIPVIASVTVSRIVGFEDLPETLHGLGFDAVTFSYPRQAPFGSSSLVYSENSRLVDFTPDELIAVLDAILDLRRRLTVLNPAASIRDVQRHLRGEPERFPCVGGFKYFYLDWNLDIWRCEAWDRPLGSVFDLDRIPDQRDRCTSCIMSCYRDTSTLMHGAVAAADAADALVGARPLAAAHALLRRSVALSVAATLHEMRTLLRLARS